MSGPSSPIASGPWEEGVQQGSDAVIGEAIDPQRLKETAAGDLRGFVQDYVLFTLGLLDPLRQALTNADVISRYAQEKNLVLRVLNLRSDVQLFAGFDKYGLEELNYSLQGLPRDTCSDFYAWLPTVSFLDRRQKQLYRLQTQSLTLFGAEVIGVWLDSTIGCAYFEHDADHSELPRVELTGYVFPQTRKLLRALLSGDSKPFDRVYDNERYKPA